MTIGPNFVEYSSTVSSSEPKCQCAAPSSKLSSTPVPSKISLHVVAHAPERRRLEALRRRRRVLGDRQEEAADVALGLPGDDAEAPAGRQHARDLARGALVVRREHAAEGRDDDVERSVLEREVLGVPLDPLGLDPGGGGVAPRVLEQLRRDVEPGDDRRRRRPPGSRRCRSRSRRRARARPP